ncbi:MAG: carbon storage regulator CsrA [Phycisphaeraceae bacterium]|nr:carbon storage regulator CsrA [Phycisphaeraceae bacterium]
MLVLSRQRDETIMIGDDIEVTVVDIRGDKVRLGINAPTKIAVHRKEVYESIRKENEDAARMSGADVGAIAPPPGAPVSPGPGRLRIRAGKTPGGPTTDDQGSTAAHCLARGLRKTG